jgi:hypothetical protein
MVAGVTGERVECVCASHAPRVIVDVHASRDRTLAAREPLYFLLQIDFETPRPTSIARSSCDTNAASLTHGFNTSARDRPVRNRMPL